MKAISKSSVSVITSYFRYNRDCNPRGYGHWAFGLGRKCPEDKDILWIMGTYSEAKKQAIAVAAEAGVSVVYVLP